MKSNVFRTRRIITVLALAFLVVLVVGLGYGYVNRQMAPVNSADNTPVEVVVAPNSNTYGIAADLADKGLIKNEKYFIWYCRLNNYDSRLQAGRYQFGPNQGVREIVSLLIDGKVMTRTITIPEGYELDQIGELAVTMGICTSEEWQEAAMADYDYGYLQDIPQRENRLEGFLYPETYSIRDETQAKGLIEMMLKTFDEVWNQEFASLAEAEGMTVFQTITLASMIEKEARFDEERARIAGVINNRLEAHMPLQIDATVLYSLGEHKERVLYKDLEIDSPYNTYRNAGLPPGPIGSPGSASIRAALEPEAHDFYYYVATEDGHHTFSRTYTQHLEQKNLN